MSEAVLDAGPLIHLSELDALDVLGDVDVLYVPDAVWEEVGKNQPQSLHYPGLHLQRVAVLTPSEELLTWARALALDRGEIEALSLMETHPNAIFLTDDAAARLAAEERGYRVHGTIGLLIRSVRRGHRQAQAVLALLRTLPQRSTLFIRPGLLETIIERLAKEWA